MIKILGVLDIAASILLFLMPFQIQFLHSVILVFACYLLIKSLVFITTPASWLDMIAAGLLFIGYFQIFALPKMLAFIFGFLMVQKGIFSLLS